jgi:beta-lactamase superfamily II metal-dependent hydrolase
MLIAATVVLGATAVGQSQKIAPLAVYWIDVEGGAATLIVTPARESLLVDTGSSGGRDAGRILKAAHDAGLQRINHLVVTHLHTDHFGGVAELSTAIPIGTLYENGIDSAPPGERAQASVAAYASAKVAARVVVKPGDAIPLTQTPGAPPLALRVLAARQQFVAASPARPNAATCGQATKKPADTSDNANSIVMVLGQGAFRMFLGGDLTWNLEERLVCPDDRVGPVDVYQSVHHGLDQSNNPVLLRTLQPHVIVFNNGPRKGFEPNAVATAKGAPSLEGLYQLHRALYEGAQNTSDDRIANRDEACTGQGIEMTVAPDGATYTVSVPATGHRRTYQTRTRSK